MRPFAPVVALACFASLAAPAQSAARIEPPPPGHWILDETRSLYASTLGDLDEIATRVDASGHGQLGVVVVSTTSGVNARRFATDLFNRWGIGHAGRDDGALLFVALADHNVEIVLGDGVDDAADLARSDAVMAQIIAKFKAGDPNGALLAGARGISKLLDAAQINARAAEVPSAPPPPAKPVTPLVLPSMRPNWVADPDDVVPANVEQRLNQISWELESERQPPIAWIFYDSSDHPGSADLVQGLARADPWISTRAWVLVAAKRGAAVQLSAPAASSIPPGARGDWRTVEQMWGEALRSFGTRIGGQDRLIEIAGKTKEFATTYELAVPLGERTSALVSEHPAPVYGGGAVALVGSLVGLSRWARRRPRRCKECGTQRELLNEQADDIHLTRGQLEEERLKSVDYDVWWCPRCNDALVLRYGALLTSYGRCPQCDFVTSSQSTRTIVSATYDHGGTVEVTESCQQCGHHGTYLRHTSRLTRTSSSSSHSHSSSSHSSFGGGHSSGRGSSGHW